VYQPDLRSREIRLTSVPGYVYSHLLYYCLLSQVTKMKCVDEAVATERRHMIIETARILLGAHSNYISLKGFRDSPPSKPLQIL